MRNATASPTTSADARQGSAPRAKGLAVVSAMGVGEGMLLLLEPAGDGDDHQQVDDHRDTEQPEEDLDPALVGELAEVGAARLRRALGGDETDGDAQAKRCAYRRIHELGMHSVVALAAERPGALLVGNVAGLLDEKDVLAQAPAADVTG